MGCDVANDWTVERLRQFETSIADAFNAGAIRAPVHLSDGNEAALLEVFADVRPGDWVYCTWRSHYQALLHGVPEDRVRREILEGRSIALCFPEHRFYSSAIVGGALPIAVGTALALKRMGSSEMVWCFMGDMTAETGMASTCIRYSEAHDLPITFVVEDNGLSVCTETSKVWGPRESAAQGLVSERVRHFRYESKYPHAGAGVRVQF